MNVAIFAIFATGAAMEDQIEWLKPESVGPAGDVKSAGGAPPVGLVLLSDWETWPDDELVNRVRATMGLVSDEAVATSDAPVPIVLIADNLNRDPAAGETARRRRWTRLIEAGGTPLEVESDEELTNLQRDPLGFARGYLAAARQAAAAPALPQPPSLPSSPSSAQATAGRRNPAEPSDPTGFRQFGQALTRLKPDQMESLMRGERHDDWRFQDQD